MYIQKDALTIRKATPKDAKLLCQWWNNGDIMAHAGFPNGIGIAEATVLKQLSRDINNNQLLIIEVDKIPIGEMNYRDVGNKTAEIGIKICDFSKQEKGYGTKSLLLLIEYLFKDQPYQKIILDTHLDNHRAQHVYEKLGFKKIQVRKSSKKNQLGTFDFLIEYELEKKNVTM